MAANIYDWSVVAANNSNSDADLTWAEGQAPSTVNNAARVMMQRGKQLLVDIGGSIAAGGTANGLTVTASSPFTAYADGMIISFRATASNSGAATLSVNAIGAKAIRKMDATGDVALIANEIRNTGIYVAQYSAALNGAAGAWLLINPTQTFAGFVTLTGVETLTNKTLTNPDINGGTLDGAVIGGSSPAAITGTTGTFTGVILAAAGSAAAPGYAFSAEPDCGMYQLSTNSLRWATAGTLAMSLGSSQDLTVVGNVTAFSDERRKKDWADLGDDFIERLAGVKMGTYTRKDTGERQVGVGAQSLQPVMPEAVLSGIDDDGEEYLSVAYGSAALAVCVELAREVCRLRALIEGGK